jgi:Zn-dependent M28 family amino/carboxypeptidase
MGYSPRTLVLGDGPQAAHNVVAEWPGSSRPSEVVLVGAHLDAFYAGADDNTSALAALLETARVVRLHRFSRTVRFVAFDLEEFGSVGSTRYVQAGYANDVRAALVLEMVGFASEEPGSQKPITGLTLPDVGNFLFVIGNDQSAEMAQRIVALGNARGLANLLGVVAPGDGAFFLSSAFMRSDHGLMWYKGIPALMFTDGGDFRNPNYHEPTDTPETLDPAFLAANTRAVVAAVALFAEVQP